MSDRDQPPRVHRRTLLAGTGAAIVTAAMGGYCAVSARRRGVDDAAAAPPAEPRLDGGTVGALSRSPILAAGSLTVVAGRIGMGAPWLASQMGLHAARVENKRVLCWPTYDYRPGVELRCALALTGGDVYAALTLDARSALGGLSVRWLDHLRRRAAEVGEAVEAAPTDIVVVDLVDTSGVDLAGARRIAQTHGVAVVVGTWLADGGAAPGPDAVRAADPDDRVVVVHRPQHAARFAEPGGRDVGWTIEREQEPVEVRLREPAGDRAVALALDPGVGVFRDGTATGGG